MIERRMSEESKMELSAPLRPLRGIAEIRDEDRAKIAGLIRVIRGVVVAYKDEYTEEGKNRPLNTKPTHVCATLDREVLAPLGALAEDLGASPVDVGKVCERWATIAQNMLSHFYPHVGSFEAMDALQMLDVNRFFVGKLSPHMESLTACLVALRERAALPVRGMDPPRPG